MRYARGVAALGVMLVVGCGESTIQGNIGIGDLNLGVDAVPPELLDAGPVGPPEVSPAPQDVSADGSGEREILASDDGSVQAPDISGPAPGEFGAPCNENEDCNSGYCIEGPNGYVCTKTCDLECPEDWACRSVVTGSSDIVFLCVPELRKLCSPCAADFQCQGGICVTLEGEGRCAPGCESDEECPSDYECVTRPESAEDEARFCLPRGGSCYCLEATDGQQRTCTTVNSLGSCFGVETCEAGIGWQGCTAQEASDEDCDGLDNDCNGLIDDALPIDAACENSVEGVGSCTGIEVCLGPSGWVCQATVPELESCDAKDNDCDELVDEDFKDEQGRYGLLTHCGSCGNDCTDRFPNGTAICEVGEDSAQCVVGSCDEGFFKASPYTCLPVQSSLCLPCNQDANCIIPGDRCLEIGNASFCGQDCSSDSVHGTECPPGYGCIAQADGHQQCIPDSNSCDCLADNAGLERSCAVANASGTCYGNEICDPAQGWSPCSASTPLAEICDGVDNDCDGVIDEDVIAPIEACQTSWENPDSGEVSTCTGDWSCTSAEAGAAWTCQAPQAGPELCDYIDNDCDGVTDEDFLAPGGSQYVELNNCGVCGYSCVGVLPNATATCALNGESASCIVESCDPGYYKVSDTTCLPVQDPTCQPCANDSSCVVPGNRCLDLDGSTVCGRDCSANNLYGTPEGECTAGFQCESFADGSRQCVPESGSCTCYVPEQEGQTRLCSNTNESGTCTGLEICQADNGWSPCDAKIPTEEICNGVDDDCDAQVDETLTEPSEPCEIVTDAGTCSGTWSCDAQWLCSASVPETELCDYIDNDCDGLTDEDFRQGDQGPYQDQDHCGLCNNSCEGAVLFATESACEVQDEAAVCVAKTCADGYFIPATTNQVCVPAAGGVACSPCSEDVHCNALADGACDTIDGGQYCTQGCDENTPCEQGYQCVNGRCLPTTLSCSCQAEDDGAVRACFITNQAGTCSGTQVCDVSTSPGWSPCTAAVPTAESCNGFDDDCDNLIDEGVIPDSETCELSNAWGTCEGVSYCGAAEGWLCSAAEPSEDVCDYSDNDCDGGVDENYRDAESGLYNTVEHCGACNYSCEGQIPHAASLSCDITKPTPTCVVDTCEAGFYRANDFTCLAVSDDRCSSCQNDADCPVPGDRCLVIDGAKHCGYDCSAGNLHGTAEGLCPDNFLCSSQGEGPAQCLPPSGSCSCLNGDEGADRPCTNSNTFGTCYGEQICDPETGWSACSAKNPGLEICNGLDDDCNGLVDDNVMPPESPCQQDNEHGLCTGSWICGVTPDDGVTWWCNANTPSPESCNFSDDDCDGVSDEDFRDEAGNYVDLFHCGSCGVSCDGAIPNATSTCTLNEGGNPQCQVDTCDPGYYPEGALTCLASQNSTCQPCVEDGNCPNPGDRCLTLDGGSFCGMDCGPDNVHNKPAGQCPGGYACTPQAEGPPQCVPTSGSCDCLPEDEGNTRACIQANDAGTCFGTETCAPGTGWTGCTATIPSLEICNALDDDCDSVPDDVEGRGEACTLNNIHGSCPGVLDCAPGNSALSCVGTTPQPELCNLLDDDCDGLTDETFPNLFTPCTVGTGACLRVGIIECDDDQSSASCTAVAGPAGTEVCDGIDNDCDGMTDDLSEAEACEKFKGVCQGAEKTCGGLDGWRPCTGPEYGADYQDVELSCDGLDNDCDGLTDEELPAQPCPEQEGVCAGSFQVCQGTLGWSTCGPQSYGDGYENVELSCDNLDNDCDGETDEGYVDATGAYTLDGACGSCFTDCTSIFDKPNGYGVCEGSSTPTCALRCCAIGDTHPSCDGSFDYYDLNGVPDDGCEFQLDPEAIYVSIDDTNAIDSGLCGLGPIGTGPVHLPCATISHALLRAKATDRARVLVADGLYIGTINLIDGISLLGAHRPDTWERHISTSLTTLRGDSSVDGHTVTMLSTQPFSKITVIEGFVIEGQNNAAPGGNSYGLYLRNSSSQLTIRDNIIVAGSGGPGAMQAAATNGASGGDGQGRTTPGVLPPSYDAFIHNSSGGGACCAVTPGIVGCSANVSIENCVCALDPFCCGLDLSLGGYWDELCVQQVVSFGCGTCNAGPSCDPSLNRQYSNGGMQSCGGTKTDGGAGGGNSCTPIYGLEASGSDGQSGMGPAGAGGNGGDAGNDGVVESAGTLCSLPMDPMTGADGANGSDGIAGIGGLGCSSPAGVIIGQHWRANSGSNGSAGIAGGGGGGGGSGGGGACTDCGGTGVRVGGHGGGGGAGGCGGQSGQGAGSGGGSFGIFVVGGGAPVISANRIFRGLGGGGGAGGNGGAGGAGGAGGDGGTCPGSCLCFKGAGKGGEGGQGGHGGGGGGGCGGASYGIYSASVGPTAYCSGSDNTISGGSGGSGGPGGLSLAAPGSVGTSGVLGDCGLSP